MDMAAGPFLEPDWDTLTGAVLLAGDANDVPDMVRIAERLPVEVSVTVLIEAFATIQRHRVRVPEHVSVTWLVRDRQPCDPSPLAVRGRGERLAMGVYAWCAEWACDPAVHCTVWLGPRTAPHIVRMAQAHLRPA
ncbi:SIP domain-containing protein [Microbacterium sp. SORGH_AS_0888]|uniref:SIP domain-containing protein n=1 Tax=Microbacterium sp. SORGH_AS_0888 TaxID=3041791 RepID=UPI00277E3B86|nr:SIP domain-containing protein [Microbacterium sp. SORGH_AS_0888]MDQ1130736.1 NADPH-dependent ferric siderophore reductase [Microbacterium sp. SORGH_AS_0888]